MEGTKWDAPQGLNNILVKREIAEDSFVRELEMQNSWEPSVEQVKRKQPPAGPDTGGTPALQGQLPSNSSVKYETEEWGRDSDSGILEETPSEFISSSLLKEEESELESDSGISEENTAQASSRPDPVQHPHEIFLEEEIVWQFTEDPYGACDPLSIEEEQQDVPLKVAVKEEQQERDSGREQQYEDVQTEPVQEPPPYWEPQPPPDGYAEPSPADPPPEGYATPPRPPPDCWDARAHILPKSHYCAVCARWFTSVPHLKRHYGTALHKRCAQEKGLPEVPVHKRQRQSWKALLDAGSVSVGSPSDSASAKLPASTPPALPPPRLPPPPEPRHPLLLPKEPPLPPSDVEKSSLVQVCRTPPQQPPQPPNIPQPIPDACRAPTCGLQPFCPYEYERQSHVTLQPFESQLCRAPWLPDSPTCRLASHARQGALHLQEQQQQQQQQYVYQQQLYEQREIQHCIREQQHKLYLQSLLQQQQQLVYPQHSRDASQFSWTPSASALRSAVTVMPTSATVDDTAGKTASPSAPNDTPYTNGRWDTSRTTSPVFHVKETRGGTVGTRQQPDSPPASQAKLATHSAPPAAGRCRSRGLVVRNIEQLKSQYPGISICAAESKAPKPTPPVSASVAPSDVSVAPSDVSVAPSDVSVAPSDVSVAPADVSVAWSDVSPDSGHVCAVCGSAFSSDLGLRQHVELLHFRQTYFQCEQCGAKIAGLAYYRAHVAEHRTDRPFSCDECSRRFTNRAHLIRHKMLHSGERPFVCHVCSKGFIRKDHMLKHTKVHNCRCAFCVTGVAC